MPDPSTEQRRNGKSIIANKSVASRAVRITRNHSFWEATELARAFYGRAEKGIESVMMLSVGRFVLIVKVICEGLMCVLG